jgi:uncharacterized protein (TIGR02118 family)
MIQFTVLYGHPQDTATFDRYFEEKHSPLAKKLPGLKGFMTHKPEPLNSQESSPAYLVAELFFEDREAFQAAMQSPEGQAAASDVENFATGGATLFVGEVQVYHPVAVS